MKNNRMLILFSFIIIIIGAIFYLDYQKVKIPTTSAEVEVIDNSYIAPEKEDKSKKYEVAKEITTPDAFINTDSLTIKENIGKKVILIDFWTYSCSNCQRTIPHLNELQEKYADDGLLIIGVHTPEFEFEKDLENVKRAVEKYSIKYPVVMDNDFSTWRAYKNRYWPRVYLIDIDGFIVYDHIGEGAYKEIENKVIELLEEKNKN